MTTDYQRNRKTGIILIGGLRARTIPWFFCHFWKCSEVVEFWYVDTFKNGQKNQGIVLALSPPIDLQFFQMIRGKHKHKDTQNTQHYLGNQWQKSHNNHNTISVLIQLHLSLAGDKPQAYKWPFHHYNPYPYNQELP